MIISILKAIIRPWIRALYFLLGNDMESREDVYLLNIARSIFWFSAIYIGQCIDEKTLHPEYPLLGLISVPIGIALTMVKEVAEDAKKIDNIRVKMEAQRGDISQV